MRSLTILLFIGLFPFTLYSQVTANFTIPDTVCLNTPVTITNTSMNATNYYWNFCVADLNKTPLATNLGNPGNLLSAPVFIDYVLVNNNYYGFLTNFDPGRLIRLDFGNSLLNTPVAVDLGNFGGALPPGAGTEGIQVVQNEGKWYAIIIGGSVLAGTTPRIVKIEFGAAITNPSPVATDWGNLSNSLEMPIDLHLFKDNNNWYGFTVNAESNTITRFDFTNSFDNIPVATNLGNIGNLSYPTGIYAIDDNGFWRVFVVNGGNNTRSTGTYSLSRLDFGNSLLNIPAGVNLGNPGNVLQHPRDITIMKSCGQIVGFAVNGHFNNKDIVQFDFNNDLTAIPSALTLGNIGNFSFPHSISKLFRVNEDLYSFVTNVDNNTITRLRFTGCTNANNPSSSLQHPPPVMYDAPGTYNINLTIDIGLPTQASICKQVVVMPKINSDFNYKQDVCNPYSIQFFNTNNTITKPYWSFGDGQTITNTLSPIHTFSAAGNYTVKFAIEQDACSDTVRKSINLNIVKEDMILTPDTTICVGATKQLRTKPSLGFCWSPTTWLDNPNAPNPITSTPQNITYYFTAQATGANLITNGDFSAGNTGFTSQYNFATPNITEGQYFVGTNPTAWNSSLSSCTDHTTGTGNMMLVNGSPTPDVNVWRQTITVQPQTDYAFSTWIQALWPPNPAQLQFSINGSGIGNMITASLPTCTWTQFYTTWNSGNNTTATIAIVNKNTFVQGNDFALDDISFAPVFIKRDSVVITVERPVIQTSNDTTVCSESPVHLKATGAATWLWSPATGLTDPRIADPIATPAVSTKYYITGTTVNGCTTKDSVEITTRAKPLIAIMNDTTICRNTPAPLRAFSAGSIIYSWSPVATLTDPAIANPVASPAVTTTYTVEVKDQHNCTNKDSIKVEIRPIPLFTASPDQPLCKGNSLVLNAGGGDQYSWSPIDFIDDPTLANPSVTPEITTQYSVHISESICNYDTTINMLITVNPKPVVTAQKSNDIDCTVHTARLFAGGAVSYTWSPIAGLDDPNRSNPIAGIDTTTTFFVKGTNQFGCFSLTPVTVYVTKTNQPVFELPNAFTPNGDGKNDCFSIKKWGGVKISEFSIFNRWGQTVFTTNNPAACWDGSFKGKPQDSGQFVYVIRAKTFCGDIQRTGLLLLIR